MANAIKFNKEYGGIIEIILSYKAKHGSNGAGALICKICDNGQGMTKKQIEQSFEAFGNVSLTKQEGQG